MAEGQAARLWGLHVRQAGHPRLGPLLAHRALERRVVLVGLVAAGLRQVQPRPNDRGNGDCERRVGPAQPANVPGLHRSSGGGVDTPALGLRTLELKWQESCTCTTHHSVGFNTSKWKINCTIHLGENHQKKKSC